MKAKSFSVKHVGAEDARHVIDKLKEQSSL